MSDFLEDLVVDILLRLPVKSLLRFRCVSRTWCALIDNNSFIKQHLNHSILTKNKHKLILECNHDIYSLGLYSLTDEPLKLVHPSNLNLPMPTLLGSCNGLLCIMFANLFIIWNPATRKHVKLPLYQSSLVNRDSRIDNCIFARGFGYDPVSDDYKVVVLIQIFSIEYDSVRTETKVYSLRSNSWKIINGFPDYIINDMQVPDALVSGTLHWNSTKRESEFGSPTNLVAAFNLVTEKHMIVALPDLPPEYKVPSVSELGGCLSIVCNNDKVGVVDVWVMKDYGVTESWTKLLIISCSIIIRMIDCLIPLAYSRSGDEVLLMINPDKLMWYNLEKKTFKFVDVLGLPKFFYAAVWLESLVSLGDKAENDKIQDGQKEGEKRERKEKMILQILYRFPYLYSFIVYIAIDDDPESCPVILRDFYYTACNNSTLWCHHSSFQVSIDLIGIYLH